jgi:SnoaL-like domain
MSPGLTTEDRLALHELIARYAHLLDHGGIDRMGEIYTPDCRFAFAAYGVDIQGLPALIDFLKSTMASLPQVRHVITNIFADGTVDGADLHAYLQIVDTAANAITTVGVYRDHCVKTPTGWRIAQRCVSIR